MTGAFATAQWWLHTPNTHPPPLPSSRVPIVLGEATCLNKGPCLSLQCSWRKCREREADPGRRLKGLAPLEGRAWFSLGSPEADLERRIPGPVVDVGRWTQDPLVRAWGQKPILAVLLSQLPLWANGVQFPWDPLGDSTEHGSLSSSFFPARGGSGSINPPSSSVIGWGSTWGHQVLLWAGQPREGPRVGVVSPT